MNYMPKNKPIVAIMYDFDKTLATTDMQNYSFIPFLGMTSEEFWGSVTEFTKETGIESILAYMYMMVEKCREKNIPLTKEYLYKLGKDVKFFDGVTTWFKRINTYAEELGIEVEHYIISSGTKEIIEGTSIAKEFKKIYACEFLYDKNGEATWPKFAINFTQKTQFVFRIAKGVYDINDNVTVNTKVEKRIPYSNLIYIGDGLTDIPCMTLVKEKGGKSIAIYPKGNKEKVIKLFEEGRVNYLCSADYKAGSNLEKIIKLILTQMALTSTLLSKENEMYNK